MNKISNILFLSTVYFIRFLLNKNYCFLRKACLKITEINAFRFRKTTVSFTLFIRRVLMVFVVNRALSALHGGSLNIMLSVLLMLAARRGLYNAQSL